MLHFDLSWYVTPYWTCVSLSKKSQKMINFHMLSKTDKQTRVTQTYRTYVILSPSLIWGPFSLKSSHDPKGPKKLCQASSLARPANKCSYHAVAVGKDDLINESNAFSIVMMLLKHFSRPGCRKKRGRAVAKFDFLPVSSPLALCSRGVSFTKSKTRFTGEWSKQGSSKKQQGSLKKKSIFRLTLMKSRLEEEMSEATGRRLKSVCVFALSYRRGAATQRRG